MIVACGAGNLEVVKYLCGLPGVDPTAENNYPVCRASRNGHLEVVKYLCGLPGVDPTTRDN